ncbi:MAG: phosphatidate cytidylyltransferase [Allosphingosinicella sp.]|uniref:phosphatidate cytidylyltransferase n=1 Tax=Allosphingosinicella sp. TaxID=2823234 RepID=UPI00394F2D65
MTAVPASSDLPTRFAAGVAMIAVASLAIWMGGWPFRLLLLAGAAVMLFEWAGMHRVPRIWAWVGTALLAAVLLGATEYLFPAGQVDEIVVGDGATMIALEQSSFDPAWIGFLAVAVAAAILGLVSRRLTMAWAILYIGLPAFALAVLSWAWFGLVFWAMIVTWSTDIFAYFAGRAIGGPKLAPRISPNKTWAGLIGGMIGAGLLGWVAAGFFDLGAPFLWLGAVMGLVAQLGDLYESAVKRRAGVKDSGGLLPGHGGVLDRVDGLLPVALLTLAIPMAGLWVG